MLSCTLSLSLHIVFSEHCHNSALLLMFQKFQRKKASRSFLLSCFFLSFDDIILLNDSSLTMISSNRAKNSLWQCMRRFNGSAHTKLFDETQLPRNFIFFFVIMSDLIVATFSVTPCFPSLLFVDVLWHNFA